MVEFTKGMILIDENRDEFEISGMDSRMLVIRRVSSGLHVETITHAFARRKYRVPGNRPKMA